MKNEDSEAEISSDKFGISVPYIQQSETSNRHINKQYSLQSIHPSLTLSTFIVRPIDKMNLFWIKELLVGFYGKWTVESGQVSTVVTVNLYGFSPYGQFSQNTLHL